MRFVYDLLKEKDSMNKLFDINALTPKAIRTLLAKPIYDLPFKRKEYKRIQTLLKKDGIETFGDLLGKTYFDLIIIRRFGEHSIASVRESLANYGLSLKPTPSPLTRLTESLRKTYPKKAILKMFKRNSIFAGILKKT